MNGDGTIDKLFKERLEEDAPAFQEEYWKKFEARLDGIPPQGVSGTSGGLSKILSGFTLTKGFFLITGLAVITAAVYFISAYKDTPEMNNPPVLATQPSTSLSREIDPQQGLTGNPQKAAGINAVISSMTRNEASLPHSQPRIDKKERVNQGFTVSKEEFIETRPLEFTSSQTVSGSIDPVVPAAAVSQADTLKSQAEEKSALSAENQDLFIPVASKDTAPSEVDRIADSAYNAIQARQAVSDKQSLNKANSVPAKDKRFGFYITPGMSLYSTFGNLEGFERKTMAAFQFGGGLEYRINDAFSVYAEANALRLKGFELTESTSSSDIFFYTWINKVTVESREYTLLQFPLMLGYHTSVHNINLGPVFRYVVSSAGEKVVEDTTMYYFNYYNSKAENFLAGINRFQPGLALEYSLNFYRHHALLIRYNLMLGDFNRNTYYSGLSGKKVNLLLVAVRFRIY
jgi:hypothetical protein